MADSTPLTTAGARYYTEATQPVDMTIDTATAATKGGLVGLTGGKAVPLSTYATKALGAAAFCGVFGQTKAAGDAQIRGNSAANKIRVDTGGVWSIPCADACTAGEYVGPKLNGGSTACLDGEVQKTATANEQIAVVVADKGASETHVLVRILSKKFGDRAILV
jgi:hypothetical protein